MKKNLLLSVLVAVIMIFSNCTTINKSMREPNVVVDFDRDDFTLSEQVQATARTTKIIGIDFERLFTCKQGQTEGGSAFISLANLPVIGNILDDKTANYALHDLMEQNPGFDVIFYPQYETKVVKPIFGIGFLTKITTVEAKARLGKLK